MEELPARFPRIFQPPLPLPFCFISCTGVSSSLAGWNWQEHVLVSRVNRYINATCVHFIAIKLRCMYHHLAVTPEKCSNFLIPSILAFRRFIRSPLSSTLLLSPLYFFRSHARSQMDKCGKKCASRIKEETCFVNFIKIMKIYIMLSGWAEKLSNGNKIFETTYSFSRLDCC